jgi:osmotically-inducible protein OsmY
MKLNAYKLLALAATVGLIAAHANADTTTSYKKNTTTSTVAPGTTYGTGTDSSGSVRNTTGTTTYGTASDTALETTGAPRVKATSKTTTTETESPSAIDQSSGTTQDVEVTRMIREGLNGNNSLSTAAKNVEIITLNNAITLRGKVASQTEKQQVASVAQSAGGTRTIHNELTVDSSKR